MTATFETLVAQFKAVVFEKDELEHRDRSQLKAILPLLANPDSDSNLRNKLHDFEKQIVFFK